MSYEINFLLLIVFILQLAVGTVAGVLFKNGISEYLQIYLTQVIPIFLPSLICCFADKNGFNTYKRDGRITPVKVFCVIVLAVCMNFLVNIFVEKIYAPILMLVSKEPLFGNDALLPNSGFDIALNVLFICLIPAIFEEILFRGIALTRYENLYGSKKAIIMCGLVFALLHASFQSLIPQFVIGIFLSYIVFRYNSLYLGMLAHFVHNLTTLFLHAAGELNPSNVSFLTERSLITFIICILLVAIIFFITRKTQKKIYFKEAIVNKYDKGKENLLFYVIVVLFIVLQIFSLLSKVI